MIKEFFPSVEITDIAYFRMFMLDKDYTFDGHTHNDLWELNIFLNGSNEITCGKSVFVAQEMQAVLIAPGVFHACGCANSGDCEKLVVEFKANGMEFDGAPFYQFNFNKEFLSLVNIMVDEAINYSDMTIYGNAGVMSGNAKKLLEVLIGRLMKMESFPMFSNDNDSLIYHRAVNFMEENLNQNPSVEEIARAANVCVTLIKRTFSKFTGKGVNAYFTDMKINAAKEMLINGKSCFEVSKALGFSSQAYFSRCFKKNTGFLPSKYEVSK